MVMHEVVHSLNLGPFAIVGYSLGGNIALQWSQIAEDPIVAIMLVSSAPMKYSPEALAAYPPYEGGCATYPYQLTELQAKQHMGACGFHVDDPAVHFMIEDAIKTDAKAREKMVASVLAGNGIDETEIVDNLTIPLAVVVGKEDATLGLNYITQLNYRNLWRGKVTFIQHAKHAIPLHQPDQLNRLLEEFLRDFEEPFASDSHE